MPQDKNKLARLRYARNPDLRLRSVNRKRVRRGMEPLQSPDEIGRDFLAFRWSRQRDGKGRFV